MSKSGSGMSNAVIVQGRIETQSVNDINTLHRVIWPLIGLLATTVFGLLTGSSRGKRRCPFWGALLAPPCAFVSEIGDKIFL